MVWSMGGILRFYWMCVRRAFSGRFWFAEKISGGFALFLGLAITYFDRWESALNWLPFAVFAAVFVGTVIVGLVLSPYLFFKEEKEKADHLAKRQEPKLRVRTANNSLQPIRRGATTEAISGNRQTVEAGRLYAVTLLCTNDGLDPVEACYCKLLAVWRKEGNDYQRVQFYESIELSWSRDIKRPVFYEFIDPNETKTVYLLSVRPEGYAWLYRNPDSIPIETQQIFGGIGKYQALVQFTSRSPAPVQVLLDIELKEDEPAINRLSRSWADVIIAEQGSPPLSRTSTDA